MLNTMQHMHDNCYHAPCIHQWRAYPLFHVSFFKTILSDPENHLYFKKKKNNKLYVHSCLTKISEIKKFEKSSFQVHDNFDKLQSIFS